jgi:HD-GYP domain-containing protein (c-di-GMP phosphodiesterase class II)
LANDLKGLHDEIDDEYIHNLGIASSLHDIGKVGIPDSILLKPGKLTSLERSIMEKHTTIGGECLEAIGSKLGENDFLLMAREVAYWHHEQWDGGGYPHKLVEDEIPISARIVAVADVYDALTSRRPYKRGMSHTESRSIILSGSGQKFDPEIVSAFLRHEDEFKKIARRYQNTLTEETPVLMQNSLAAIAEPQTVGTPQTTG